MRISDWSSDVCSSDLDSGLAGLAVADDQLALTAADGNQRVNGLEAGLYRLMHRLARNDARRFLFDAHALRILHRAPAIVGIAKTVDNAAQHTLADWPVPAGAGSLVGGAFLYLAELE